MKTKKPLLSPANKALQDHIERLKREFKNRADDFHHIMTHGGGTQSIHIGPTLNELNNLFSAIVAAHNALRIVRQAEEP